MVSPNTFDASILICAYSDERWDDLIEVIKSCQKQTVAAKQIIVIVDHNEPMMERLRDSFGDIVIAPNAEKRGLSGARNTGLKLVTGSVVIFIDDDAVAGPDWLEQLARHYADPNVLGVGGPIVPMWLSGRPTWFPEEFDWIVGCTYKGMPEETAHVRSLIGCNMSLRREVFEAVGDFRTTMGRIGKYPIAGEETELCHRAQQHWPTGYFIYEPQAKVNHRVPKTRANWGYYRLRAYCEGLSKVLVYQKASSNAKLATERDYTLKTLPRGVFKGMGDAVRGDVSGVGRAAAIVAGLAITVTGYGVGTLMQKRKS